MYISTLFGNIGYILASCILAFSFNLTAALKYLCKNIFLPSIIPLSFLILSISNFVVFFTSIFLTINMSEVRANTINPVNAIAKSIVNNIFVPFPFSASLILSPLFFF